MLLMQNKLNTEYSGSKWRNIHTSVQLFNNQERALVEQSKLNFRQFFVFFLGDVFVAIIILDRTIYVYARNNFTKRMT